jgi:mono/diheme cytochrome c family protein
MSRPLKVLLITCSLFAVAAFATACGTQKITVPKSQAQLYRGAVLFSQRCAGCHTLSYAATHGSASNIRSAEITNGPNLDQRCERPVTRVLYAIQNGGFSGAIMPQNVIVGEDARDVAMFVSRFAGTQATKSPGVSSCQSEPIGVLPPPVALTAAGTAVAATKAAGAAPAPTTTSTTSTTTTSTTTTSATTKAKAKHKKKK